MMIVPFGSAVVTWAHSGIRINRSSGKRIVLIVLFDMVCLPCLIFLGSKNPGPEDPALVVPRGDLHYLNYKYQIPNIKQTPMTKI
jgi:hypothetical protein